MVLALTLVLLQTPAPRPDPLVVAALAADRIEVFDSAVGHPKLVKAVPMELNGDTIPEWAVAIQPDFRQTPTILIYRRGSDGALVRIVEGLAPGRLVPVDGSQRDTHTFGVGVDFTPESTGTPLDTTNLMRMANRTGLSIVGYGTFFHADMRSRTTYVIRNSGKTVPADTSLSCAHFQFAPVLDLAYGTLRGDPANRYLVALTPGQITLYRFSALSADGWIEKRTIVRDVPEGRARLERNGSGEIALIVGSTRQVVGAPAE